MEEWLTLDVLWDALSSDLAPRSCVPPSRRDEKVSLEIPEKINNNSN